MTPMTGPSMTVDHHRPVSNRHHQTPARPTPPGTVDDVPYIRRISQLTFVEHTPILPPELRDQDTTGDAVEIVRVVDNDRHIHVTWQHAQPSNSRRLHAAVHLRCGNSWLHPDLDATQPWNQPVHPDDLAAGYDTSMLAHRVLTNCALTVELYQSTALCWQTLTDADGTISHWLHLVAGTFTAPPQPHRHTLSGSLTYSPSFRWHPDHLLSRPARLSA